MTKSIRPRGRNKTAAVLSYLFIAASIACGGQETVERAAGAPLTLQDCIAIALQESPALESTRLDVAAASEEIRAARGQALPKITGAASYDLFSGSPANKFGVVNLGEQPVGIGTNRPGKSIDVGAVELYSARLEYPLFKDGSILGLNTGPAVASKEAKKRNLAWTSRLRREEVIARVTETFISTVSALNRAGNAERRVQLLQRQSDILREQQMQGLTLPIDLKLSEGQLGGARSLAKILRQQAIAGEIEMARALGLSSRAELHLSNQLPEPPEPPSAEQILGPVLSQHPSLQVQKAKIDEARENYRLERFRLYPSVTMDGSAIYIDDFSPAHASILAGAVTVNVPIFDFGAQSATARGKLMEYKSEQSKLSAVAEDVTFEVVKIYQAIYILSQNILELQQDVSKAQRDVQVTNSQQQQGISSPLVAVEKELHLIAKRDSLDGLETRRLQLYSALQKASGGAWKWIQ